ncbi:UDP-3-O-(3-hydroxymyristoyl)glucosamine N-acyltransferase [Lutibacter sp. B2]|nr:UDP-3-O-(3-hydroxymyristoyl)glucosamine N-acyltransferase [Lutibacter sp. B2]
MKFEHKFNFNINKLKDIKGYDVRSYKDIVIMNVSTINNPKNNTLIFSSIWNAEIENNLIIIKDSLILITNRTKEINEKIKKNNQCIFVDNPRKEYAIILKSILKNNNKKRKYKQLDCNCIIGENVFIGKNVEIEPFVFIDHDVKIGDHCVIKSGVHISSYVEIGNDTMIRENSVIGGPGFGIERATDGIPIKIPHIGGVKIGENVEVGALNSIVSGTMEPTVLEDYVITDDLVFIAHNCKIGKGTVVIACAEVSGSTIIGENSSIGPNAALMQHIQLGKNCIVGLGAVVTKSFGDHEIIAGNPADSMENVKLIRKLLKKKIDNLK